MRSEAELWSLDPGQGRSVRATLGTSETQGFSELGLHWDDGKPVKGLLKLSDVDLQSLVDLVFDHAKKHGIKITPPGKSKHLR